jgi:predicted transcriptional regulator
MLNAIKMEVKPEEIIQAVKKMKKREREAFLEELIASVSPEYLESIKEARADYNAGRVKTHEEVFTR